MLDNEGRLELLTCVYDLHDLNEKQMIRMKSQVFGLITPQGCGGITHKYVSELLAKPNLRYIIFANIETKKESDDDNHYSQRPIAMMLITEQKHYTAEIELICNYSVPKYDTFDIYKFDNKIKKKYNVKFLSQLKPEIREQYNEERDKLINATIKTGLGVVLMCLGLKFLSQQGFKRVSLEAAHIGLIYYYHRFGFTLSDRHCGATLPKKDIIAYQQLIKKKIKPQEFDFEKYKTKSKSYKMRLCDLDKGINFACKWAKKYLNQTLPQTFWDGDFFL